MRILMVDDNLLAIETVAEELQKIGHCVETCSKLSEAEQLLRMSVAEGNPFRGLILDMLINAPPNTPSRHEPFHGIAFFGKLPSIVPRELLSVVVLTHNEDPRIDDGMDLEAKMHNPPLEYRMLKYSNPGMFPNIVKEIHSFLLLKQTPRIDLISGKTEQLVSEIKKLNKEQLRHLKLLLQEAGVSLES